MKQINSSDPGHSPTNAPFFITKKTRKGGGGPPPRKPPLTGEVGERQRCPEGLRHLTAAPYLDASRMLSARISPSSVIMEPFLSG